MPAPANTSRPPSQAGFSLRAKTRLLELGWSISDVARRLGVNRMTVSEAINHDRFKPTRLRVAKILGIKP